jgi:hypothetical protein
MFIALALGTFPVGRFGRTHRRTQWRRGLRHD